MNNWKQICRETKLKLDSMTIIMLIGMAVSAVIIVLSFVLRFPISLSSILDSPFMSSDSKYVALDYISMLPLAIISIVIGILYNIKNNKKSFDHIGASGTTYCMSNASSMLIMAILLSLFMAMIEVIIVVIAGATINFPVASNINVDLMTRVWTNFGIYIVVAYSIFQLITFLINNIMNRNYIRAVILVAVPVVMFTISALIINRLYYVFDNEFLNSIGAYSIALLSGVLISNAIDALICVYGGMIR